MIRKNESREKTFTDESNTNLNASERQRRSPPQPTRPVKDWFRILIAIMTFFLGMTVLMDSAVLIGLA